ncbi:gamma-glutamylcyclotransferase [uncultured Tenacibaculum sp.]|uniref:gamma-glutamylcyclotransferase n=1 Tax=uncultured Tenacibaculum sp. TaxID=174713 RepID=UPI0026213B7B|nr:gamma-glutamylcyclotransferase [uncultured Tenacibaculum sp.]
MEEIGKKDFFWGKLYKEGWGSEMGFPGIPLDDTAEMINGFVFYSNKLAQNWTELDEFEGKAYQRVKATITLEDNKEEVEAYIYALK